MSPVGGLCTSHSPDFVYDFSLTFIAGDFSWNERQGSNPAAVVMDVKTFMHELGHVFGSVRARARGSEGLVERRATSPCRHRCPNLQLHVCRFTHTKCVR